VNQIERAVGPPDLAYLGHNRMYRFRMNPGVRNPKNAKQGVLNLYVAEKTSSNRRLPD
jgi:hypothetical protein